MKNISSKNELIWNSVEYDLNNYLSWMEGDDRYKIIVTVTEQFKKIFSYEPFLSVNDIKFQNAIYALTLYFADEEVQKIELKKQKKMTIFKKMTFIVTLALMTSILI